MTDHVTCYESDEPVLTQIYDPNGNAMTMGEIVARINGNTESSGTSAMFDDYCDTLSLLTKYADKPTLKDRVQAVLDEVVRLSQRREERHEEALDCLEESGAEIEQLKAEVARLRTERDALIFAFMVQVGFAIVTNEEQSKDVALAYELGRKLRTDKDKWHAAEVGEGDR